MVQIQAASLVKVDRELLDQARAAFTPRDITADMSRDQIMLDAGAKKVLDWIEAKMAKAAHKTTLSTVSPDLLPDSMETVLRNAFGGTKR